MEDQLLSLFEVSQRLGVSPSAIKKRVVSLNLPVKRGARGKLIFDVAAFALLTRADAMLKAGSDFEACRRELGLDPIKEARNIEAPSERQPGAPVYIQLRPRKQGGDLLKRIDAAFQLIAQKDLQSQALQDKLVGAYEEISRLSATSAAFQERAANLGHELERLQAEIRLLEAPPPARPWWRFWRRF